MAQLSIDQFWYGVLVKNVNLIWKIIYEQNNVIFTADVQLCSTKISFWGRVGADRGTTHGPPLELLLVGGLHLCCQGNKRHCIPVSDHHHHHHLQFTEDINCIVGKALSRAYLICTVHTVC